MNCPCCEIKLTRKMINDIEIDECEKCKGMWFEDDELRQAKDSEDEDLNWLDFEIWKHEDQFKTESRSLPCPQCSKVLLVAINYAGTDIEVDFCPTCKGTWLDKGEFQEIIEALKNELLTKSASDYLKASLEEAKEIITGPESFISEWKDFTTVLRMMQYKLFAGKPKLLNVIISTQEANPLK